MGISAAEHRMRIGLHAIRAKGYVGTPGYGRGMGMIIDIIYKTFYNYDITLGHGLTTNTDRTHETETKTTIKCVIFLHLYLMLLSTIIACYTACIKKCGESSLVNNYHLNYSASALYETQLRGLKNWAVIFTTLCMVNISTRENIILAISRNHKRRRLCYSTWSIPVIQSSFMYNTTLLNLLLIVITNPCIVNPGPQSVSNIKVSYCNAQGFILMSSMKGNQPIFQTRKLLDFQSFLHFKKPDIVLINETWLNEHINSNEIVGEEYYKTFRVDRTDEDKRKYGKVGGGGVLILCRQDIDVMIKAVKIQTHLPIVSVEMKFKDNSKVCLSTFYRYGYSDYLDFLESEKYYREICRKYSDVIIVGDLNLSSVKDWNCPETNCELESQTIDLFNDLGMIAQLNHSTHIAGNVLDQILTNRSNLLTNISIEPDSICKSDHHSIHFEISKKRFKKKVQRRKVFSYKRANWKDINTELNSKNWYRLLNSADMEQNLVSFKSTIDIVLRKYIPMVTIRGKFQPAWFDSEMNELKKHEDMLRKKAKSPHATYNDKEAFTTFDLLYKEKSLAKKKDYLTTADVGEDETTIINKKFWSHIKNTSKSCRIPDSIHHNGRYRTEPTDKCEMFNTFFCDQFSESSSYDISNLLTSTRIDMFFHPLHVQKLLRGVKPNKAAGPDGIDGTILKYCSDSLHIPLCILFSKSYESGYLPQDWRNANVVPVHKKGDKAYVENYRPISLTSLVMKLFEKCLRDKIIDICGDKITSCQHGFVPKKSCTSQMIDFTCDLSLNLNSGVQTDIIYFDFAKAFDSVSHDVILKKLKSQYSIDGKLLILLRNYLKGRYQRVVLDGHFSSWQPVLSGVPQGSVLGPTLFILFINDIVLSVSDDTKVLLYADDMKIWRKIATTSDQNDLQRDLDNLYAWSITNKMKFHPSKCKVLQSKLKHIFRPANYYMNGSILTVSDCERDLGVLINPKLIFNEHHRSLLVQSSQKLGLVKRNYSFTKCINSRKILYLSLIRSLFEHCSAVWSPCNQTQMDKFAKIQKRAVKWVFNETYERYPRSEYLKKLRYLNVLPIDLKFKVNDMVIFHKIFYDKFPLNLPQYIVKNSQSHSSQFFQRQTRTYNDNDRLKVKLTITPRINAFKNSFFVRSSHVWNSLPLEIRSQTNTDTFKKGLTSYFWRELEIT